MCLWSNFKGLEPMRQAKRLWFGELKEYISTRAVVDTYSRNIEGQELLDRFASSY